jgi:2'-5' RNA ligase
MTDHLSSIRAFFAVDIPDPIKKTIFKIIITELNKYIKKNHVRWSSPDHLHITLQFMPSIKMTDINLLIDQEKIELKEKPFHLKLGPLEFFPDKNKPKIISLHISMGNNELEKLSVLLGNILNNLNYPTEKRSFRPHLTLGKLTVYPQKDLLENIKIPSLEMEVNEVILFESKQINLEMTYIPLTKILLKN